MVPEGGGAVDLADPGSTRNLVREAAPDVIVNAAAYTAVDQAEGEERELARRINAEAPVCSAVYCANAASP